MRYVKTTKRVGDNAHLSFKDLKILDIRRRSIPDLCENMKVLVIGCVDMIEMLELEDYMKSGQHQFYNIHKKAREAWGIDINEKGIDELKKMNLKVEKCDLFKDEISCLEEEYDIVVISHVIEHVLDIYGFMNKILNKVKFKEAIFAVPNAYNIKHAFPAILFQRERVSNDHYYTFTPITFIKFLQGFNLEVEEVYFDADRKIKRGKKNLILGFIWSLIKSKVFTKSGDLVVIARKK